MKNLVIKVTGNAYINNRNAAETTANPNDTEPAGRETKPLQLRAFNTAVRSVLNAFSRAYASAEETLSFMRGAYKQIGVNIDPVAGKHRLTATKIAEYNGILSETGRPHAHAVASIIERLNIAPEHISVIPYGLVGVAVRYDCYVLKAVREWIKRNDLPREIPHLDFYYHIYYDRDRMFLYESEGD